MDRSQVATKPRFMEISRIHNRTHAAVQIFCPRQVYRWVEMQVFSRSFDTAIGECRGFTRPCNQPVWQRIGHLADAGCRECGVSKLSFDLIYRSSDQTSSVSSTKKRPCQNYKPGVAGSCKFGMACHFLHTDGPLASWYGGFSTVVPVLLADLTFFS